MFFIKKREVWSKYNKRVSAKGPRKRKTTKTHLGRDNPATKAQQGGDRHETRSTPQTRILHDGSHFTYMPLQKFAVTLMP
jgi:hypothetical protein